MPIFALRTERAENADALRVATGHQADAGRGADGSRRMEVGEDAALVGHVVEMGRLVGLRAERADIGVAHVVDEDDDDVRRVSARLCSRPSGRPRCRYRQRENEAREPPNECTET